MKIDIERLGLKGVEVDPETLFDFPKGLAGFEQYHRFKLFHEEGKPTVFWLQCIDDFDVMFPVMAPDLLDLEYQIELRDDECALLELAQPEEAVVVVIIYRNEAQDGKIAANTRSPLILNPNSRKGMQKFLADFQPTLVFRGR